MIETVMILMIFVASSDASIRGRVFAGGSSAIFAHHLGWQAGVCQVLHLVPSFLIMISWHYIATLYHVVLSRHNVTSSYHVIVSRHHIASSYCVIILRHHIM